MTFEAALELSQKVGLPVVVLGAGVVVLWRIGGLLIRALVEAHKGQVTSLEADRDHFRDRSEAAEDRVNGLCQSMIADLRRSTEHDHTDGEAAR
jgi:hypothetical protein